MAGTGLYVDPQAVGRRCAVKSPDYQPLTPLDWVVLDFTDGLRSLDEMSQLVPATHEQLAESYIHLRLLGFITWNPTGNRSKPQPASRPKSSDSFDKHSHLPPVLNQSDTMDPNKTMGIGSFIASMASVQLPPSPHQISDEVCAQYLPSHWIARFREFQPELVDESLDIPVETQIFAEFIYQNLSSMTHQDLLGLPEGSKDKAAVRQGYMLRTKQFHPDRYFRKNIGPFTPRIAAIFKAVTVAFTTLQTMR